MFFSSLLSLLFSPFASNEFEPIQPIPWHEASIFQVNTDLDPQVESIVDSYLKNIRKKGYITNQQGIWIETPWAVLADHRGKTPAPAASLTKVATTIASLKTWELDHRFLTQFYTTGDINPEGVLQGDLIIETQGDPLFVWEEAIAVGNKLTELGIREIEGNLLIVGQWQMNYKTDIVKSAQLFLQSLNSTKWSATIEKQYKTVEVHLNRPKIQFNGKVTIAKQLPRKSQLLFTHESLTLREILRLMNVYSNNYIAESLAQKIGGGKKVAEIAAEIANVPTSEVLLINGSGLGVDNRISPRAASRMFMALDQMLADEEVNVGDLFPVAGVDITGTIEERNIPSGIAGKTGTLAVVSALSGTISTLEREKVYFAIINYGNGIPTMRRNQDILLQDLAQHWQLQELTPNKSIVSKFGAKERIF